MAVDRNALVRDARSAMDRSRVALANGETQFAVESARDAYTLARRHGAHQLLSEAYVVYIAALAADEETASSEEYRQKVEGAFGWAETMPEEIEAWLFPFLVPHLEAIDEPRLAVRAAARAQKASRQLDAGHLDVSHLCQANHLDDLTAGRSIDAKALSLERMGALYADDLFDTDGLMPLDAAQLWRTAGRADRAEFLESVVAQIRDR